MTGPPNRSETGNLADDTARPQRVTSFVDDFATARPQSKRDRWLERYLEFLDRKSGTSSESRGSVAQGHLQQVRTARLIPF
jgi:hypothetical protein